eukprot:CFRG4495T1
MENEQTLEKENYDNMDKKSLNSPPETDMQKHVKLLSSPRNTCEENKGISRLDDVNYQVDAVIMKDDYLASKSPSCHRQKADMVPNNQVKRFPVQEPPSKPHSVSLPRMSDGLQTITLHRRATGDRFGLTLSKVGHCLYVVCVRPGFLAYTSGMRFGDQIVSINGVETFDLDVTTCTDLINGGVIPQPTRPSKTPSLSSVGTESEANIDEHDVLSRAPSGVNVLTFSSKSSKQHSGDREVAPPQLRGIELPEHSAYKDFSQATHKMSSMNLSPQVCYLNPEPRVQVSNTDLSQSISPKPSQARDNTSATACEPKSRFKDLKCVLGVHFQPDVRTCTVQLYKTTDIGISVRRGCVVKVLPGSPAQSSGIMRGDVIIDVNGYTAIGKRRHEIYHMIRINDPGSVVMVQVMAESKFKILTTVLDPKTLGKMMSY